MRTKIECPSSKRWIRFGVLEARPEGSRVWTPRKRGGTPGFSHDDPRPRGAAEALRMGSYRPYDFYRQPNIVTKATPSPSIPKGQRPAQ